MANAYYHDGGPLDGQTVDVPTYDDGNEYTLYNVEGGDYQRQDNGDGNGPYYVFV